MNLPAHALLHSLRRFVGLRSAWRRSLALEPVGRAPSDPPRTDSQVPAGDDQADSSPPPALRDLQGCLSPEAQGCTG